MFTEVIPTLPFPFSGVVSLQVAASQQLPCRPYLTTQTIVELSKLLTIQNVTMTPPPHNNQSQAIQHQEVVHLSKTWFPRSQLFHTNFTSDDTIKQKEFSLCAKIFRRQRIWMNYSAKQIAAEMRCSDTTILRFETLRLSLWSMRKWKPHLENWLAKRLVPNRVSPLTKDPEVLKTYKTPRRPWRP